MSAETESRDEPVDGGRDEPADVVQDRLSAVLAPLGRPVALAFLFVVAATFYEVVMRYFLNAPTFWVHETTIAAVGVCFAFGGAYCVATDRHIRVVLLYDLMGARTRRAFDVGISTVCAAACGLMAWAAYDLAFKAFFRPDGSFRLETSGSAWNPPTPAIVKAVLFVMLCVMTVQFALQAVRHLRRDPAERAVGEAGAERHDG